VNGCSLVRTIPVQNTLGECILWDEETQSVWWTDIHESRLYRYHHASASLVRFGCPERLCSFGFVVGDHRLVCAFASGFALFDPVSGDLQWLYRPEQDYRGTRFNDGRVDRRGRFWAGTMVEGDGRDAQGRPAKGSLYRISGSEQRRIFGGISISNSLCFSPDGEVLYFADSPERRIMAYGIDRVSGEPAEARIFATVSGDGAPDGSTVDAEGCLWNAQWGGSKVVRYTRAGEVDCVLELPVSQPTCVCFGGAGLDLLFVSSARENLGPERLAAEPEAGNVLIYTTDFRGLAESRFRTLT
jgi:sugar lactone lactonase YvrE